MSSPTGSRVRVPDAPIESTSGTQAQEPEASTSGVQVAEVGATSKSKGKEKTKEKTTPLFPGPDRESLPQNPARDRTTVRYKHAIPVPYDSIPEKDDDVDMAVLFANRRFKNLRTAWERTGWAMYDTVLGSGTYGTVNLGFKLSDKDLPIEERKLCAIKLLPAYYKSSVGPTMKQYKVLWQEVVTMRCLSHSSLCRLFDSYVCNETNKKQDMIVYLVMEFCDAGTLFDEVYNSQQEKLSEGLSRHYFRQVVSGLKYMHDKGIAHCDLHVNNVMLRHTVHGTKRCLITDFGLSEICWQKSDRPFTPFAGVPAPPPGFEFASSSSTVSGHIQNMMPELQQLVLVRPGDQQPFIVEGWLYLSQDVFRVGCLLSTMMGGITYPDCSPNDEYRCRDHGVRDQEAAAFLDSILRTTAENRPSINEVWEHPWLKKTIGHPNYEEENDGFVSELLPPQQQVGHQEPPVEGMAVDDVPANPGIKKRKRDDDD